MKLVTYSHAGQRHCGAVKDRGVINLSGIAPDMLSLIEQGDEGLSRAQAAVDEASDLTPLNSVKLLAPIPEPRRNIMCLGLNYAEHAVEHYSASGRQTVLPDYPIVFNKATTSANGPYDDIPIDPSVSGEYDWEVELAIIIGHRGKKIPREQALDWVYGYMVLNDISARDLQRRHKQYFLGKSLDGACPMGPWIVTADEVEDPQALRITSRVNDVIKQDSSTSLMIFDVSATIEHLSLGMTLLPGDIIATGTPDGVGFARQPPEFLKDGDLKSLTAKKTRHRRSGSQESDRSLIKTTSTS